MNENNIEPEYGVNFVYVMHYALVIHIGCIYECNVIIPQSDYAQ